MAICVDIVPTPCGGTNKLTMKDACNDVHFTGIEDTTINQGVGIDLTEGIHAYDGNGNEIEYTVTPDSIDKCDVGEHTVVYRTIGEGDKFLPSFCMDNVDVTLGDTFCNEILLEEDRIVTITQADPPTIEGIETIPTIYPNEEFDPTEGITATDDNGKTIDFTYSGRVEDSSEGAIASFETEFEQDALSVVADIEPIQSLNGYDKPWVGGAGKNLLPMTLDNMKSINTAGTWSGNAYTLNGITYTVNVDGGGNVESVNANGTASAYSLFRLCNEITYTAETILNGCPSGGSYSSYRLQAEGGTTRQDVGGGVAIPANEAKTRIIIVVPQDTSASNVLFKPMIRLSTVSDNTYAPYSNICPISGRTEVVTIVSPTTSASDGQTYTTALGRTVYGGTLDVVSGKLTVDRAIATYNGTESWVPDGRGAFYIDCHDMKKLLDYTTAIVCDKMETFANCYVQTFVNASEGICGYPDRNNVYPNQNWIYAKGGGATKASAFKAWLADNPLQVVYELATPQTIQLTPQEVQTLLGQNNIWADTGDIKVIYEKEMPASGNIEYLTAGSKIITYTATDECGNQTVEQRIVYVLGDTPQVCMAEVCTAHVACEDNQ